MADINKKNSLLFISKSNEKIRKIEEKVDLQKAV